MHRVEAMMALLALISLALAKLVAPQSATASSLLASKNGLSIESLSVHSSLLVDDVDLLVWLRGLRAEMWAMEQLEARTNATVGALQQTVVNIQEAAQQQEARANATVAGLQTQVTQLQQQITN